MISPQDSGSIESYRALVERSPYLMLKHDMVGVLRYASPAAAELIGYAPDELVGRSVLDLLHRSEHDDMRRVYRTVRSKGIGQALEHRLRHKNGDYVWFNTAFMPDTARDIVTYSHPITQTKNVQAALRILAQPDADSDWNEYFRVLVSHVTAALHVAFGFITLLGDDGRHVRMLAFWKGSDFSEPYAYSLDNTPCDDVITGGKTCLYLFGIQQRFPKDADLVALDAQGYLGMPVYSVNHNVIGHLALLDNKPLRLTETDIHLARLFTLRAGIAIERMQQQ